MTITSEPPVSDETALLLACARQGDDDAFSRLAAAQETRLYQQAVALCRDLDAAADLVAETMVEAWRSLSRFDGTCRFSTWLYAILLHRCQKLARRNRSRPASLTSLPGNEAAQQETRLAGLADPQPTALEALVRHELATRLQAVLATLPEPHQAVILLRFYEDASLAEIAAALHLPLGTVKSRLHHALAKLRQMPAVMNLFNASGDT